MPLDPTAPTSPAASSFSRRSLLATGLAAPAVVTASAGPAAAAAPAATAGRHRPARSGGVDPDSPRFTLAVLPDTQYLFDGDSAEPTPVRATLRWLRENRTAQNIVFLAQLGDVTEHGSDDEVALAARVWDEELPVGGREDLPYSVLAGNHDVSGDDQRGPTPYLERFGPDRFRAMPTFGGASPDGYHTFHVFRAGGRDWLLLALDWRASAAGTAWAAGVLDAHPTLPVILTTHEFVAADEAGAASLSEYGTTLWQDLVRGRDQVFLTLNGHFWPVGRTVLVNDAGHEVHAHLTNYQDQYYGGAGTVRLYRFDLARGVVDVETISPWLLSLPEEQRSPLQQQTLERTTDLDRFSFGLVPAERFAGFAPPALPRPRPAEAVVTADTAAYWRFDEIGGVEGAVVGAGTVVRDRTGNGNDVTARLIGAAGAGTLTWSGDHHDGAPAHASLRFDGHKDPDGGAVLETGPDAPVNSEQFLDGFTLEVFLKLPDPFVGDHAWMGVLSWEGNNGDAGKTSGYTTEEPSCSLNVTSEWFLQFVLYPSADDVNPTSWSHALTPGRWTHVAVVNDGERTVVFVDGSRIARNPTQRARGIATLGKPFAIGATQSDEQFGQGFYGWIGDVRISSRALDVTDFLSAPGTGPGRP
ncbi:LamG-like jellyroll fold domain-containing protein [Kineococcus sp. SYSU DK002]|uniref:LamG-like jellyroll fold domain-containing protein n=1 Tax=Kineococcus sp. SYSU DK002 TaxID=3383123 RepID=UPI003D7E1488